MESKVPSRISIQVSLSGYSFCLSGPEGQKKSAWMGPDRMFSTPEFQMRYDTVEIALFTPKCTLVPESFFDEASARDTLGAVCGLKASDRISSVQVPQFGAVMVFSDSVEDSLSDAISKTVLSTDGSQARPLPELWYVLRAVPECEEYNKIVASYRDGLLCLAVAQGRSLLLANCFQAPDFTSAEYFIFLAMKKLQLNPEVSTICFRTPLSHDEEMSLYRYFKSVEVI